MPWSKNEGGVMALHDDRSVGRVSRPGVFAGVAPTFGLTAKRAFDIAAATVALLVLAPLMLVISAAIKLESSGPVFLRETVYGYKNRAIRTFKFRSAIVQGGTRANGHATWVGQILLRTGIDQLPRLFTVLRGEMSIVGPLPSACRQDLIDNRHISLLASLKPGMTGPRVFGFCERYNPTEQRINDDLHYARNWSLFLDIKIILATLCS
jgi:lipopolysaccharide/colanic/teichoic acid biosynthesis glycosyltransferase